MHQACLGGSFNPIHHGHLIAACEAMRARAIDRVILMVSANPPHKRGDDLAPAHHRYAMARLAVEGDARFAVSDLELRREGPSYTFDTVQELKKGLGPDDELSWIVGSDSVGELHTWHRVGELLEAVRLIVVSRSDRPFAETARLRGVVGDEPVERLERDAVRIEPVGVSSTRLRKMTARGESLRYYTPPAVFNYIREVGLYSV